MVHRKEIDREMITVKDEIRCFGYHAKGDIHTLKRRVQYRAAQAKSLVSPKHRRPGQGKVA